MIGRIGWTAMRHALATAVLFAVWGLWVFASTTIAQADYGPAAAPKSELEQRLFAEAAKGRLDALSPLAAALVASGVEDAGSLCRYQQRAAAFADELRQRQSPAGTQRQQVEAVFEFMHRRILRGGYDLAYTDLRRTLDEGRFNCLSATVLFDYLAGELGIECRAVEMPHHVISRVRLPDHTLDIETTCPRWFQNMPRSGGDGPTGGITVRQTGLDFQNKQSGPSCGGGREVSPIQLAAMIYYNRGVDLLVAKRFAEAADANASALRLDPQNAVARGNLLATLNNWSIALGEAGQYAAAIGRLRQGLAIDPTFAALTQNYVHYHCRWAGQLSQAGRLDEAIAILSRAASEMPDREDLSQAVAELRQRQTAK
jgi:tetratricopeptide (TPR) repeat protein